MRQGLSRPNQITPKLEDAGDVLRRGLCVGLQESWLYHLSVAAGALLGKVGTEFEQLAGKLFQLDGDPSEF